MVIGPAPARSCSRTRDCSCSDWPQARYSGCCSTPPTHDVSADPRNIDPPICCRLLVTPLRGAIQTWMLFASSTGFTQGNAKLCGQMSREPSPRQRHLAGHGSAGRTVGAASDNWEGRSPFVDFCLQSMGKWPTMLLWMNRRRMPDASAALEGNHEYHARRKSRLLERLGELVERVPRSGRRLESMSSPAWACPFACGAGSHGRCAR